MQEKEPPPMQKNSNNPPAQAPAPTSNASNENAKEEQKTVPTPPKVFYQQWWFPRIVGAIIGGGIVAYYSSKYAGLHFGDTWLGLSALVGVVLLMRNPKNRYFRQASYCLAVIGGINILSQLEVVFNTDNLLFNLGIGDQPIISVLFGIVAVVLFYLDYQERKNDK